MCEAARSATGAQVIVLPELAITSYTCEDLFWQDALLRAAEEGLARFAELTADVDALVFVGVPVRVASKLYNCAAVLCAGELLALVPKRNIPTYGEFYEGRRFSAGPEDVTLVSFAGYGEVPFGSSQLFECDTVPGLIVAAEICEDLWVPNPPSTAAALAGATLVVNLSASNELVGKADYRRGLVSSTSARLVCAYAYASAGWGESTQDVVYGGHCLVAENGRVLGEAAPLADEPLVQAGDKPASTGVTTVIDLGLLAHDRLRMSTFDVDPAAAGFVVSPFSLCVRQTPWRSLRGPAPVRAGSPRGRAERCESILPFRRTAWPSAWRTRTPSAPSLACRAASTRRWRCSSARAPLTCWGSSAPAFSPSRCPALVPRAAPTATRRP